MASSSLRYEREQENPRNSKLCCFSDLKVPSWFSFFWLLSEPSYACLYIISRYCRFFFFSLVEGLEENAYSIFPEAEVGSFFHSSFSYPPPQIFKRYLIRASLSSVLIFSTFGSLFGICQLLCKRDDCSKRSPGVFYRFFFLFSSATLFDLHVFSKTSGFVFNLSVSLRAKHW